MSIFNRKKLTLLQKLQHAFMRKKPDNRFIRTIDALVSKYGLPFGVGLAIVIAVLLSVLSMTLYFVSGTAKLDLSRPGYESARNQINHDDGTEENFPASGALDGKVMKDFIGMYDKRVKSLEQYDTFSQNILDDAQIGLVEQQVAPSDGAVE